MPFTLSHPAAAVPLARFGLPLSPLIVGSMAPDFPYVLTLSTKAQYGHTWQGVFLFCVPVGLLVLWIFHAFLKYPLLSLAPARHKRRLGPVAAGFRFGPSAQFGLILVALALGAFTHLAWDSFTHEHGWSVQHVALLRAPLLVTSHGTLYTYKALQHGSSLAGAGMLIWWSVRWFRTAESRTADGQLPPS